MAELQQRERLQPALLDRLTDDYPHKRKAKLESSFLHPYPKISGSGSHGSEDSPGSQETQGSQEIADDRVKADLDPESRDQANVNPNYPSIHTPAADSSDRLVISARKLRDIVKRDLSWLMNTGNLESVQNLDDFPLVKESVINYGVPDLTGVGVDNVNTAELERRLHRILLRYEPRILRKTLRVTISKSQEMSRNALRFDIECDIWGQPAPEHIHLNSELDLGLGSFKFTEASLG